MARYFFDSTVSSDLVEDEDGIELSDIMAVRYRALDALADVARHAIPKGAISVSIVVRNEVGDVVHNLAVTLTEKPMGRAGRARPRHPEIARVLRL